MSTIYVSTDTVIPTNAGGIIGTADTAVYAYIPSIGTSLGQVRAGKRYRVINLGSNVLTLAIAGTIVQKVQPGVEGYLVASPVGWRFSEGPVERAVHERSVTLRGGLPYATLSSGTNQTATYRVRRYVPATHGIANFKLVYSNVTLTASGETNGDADYTVKAVIELPDASLHPVTFRGAASASVANGTHLVSDPVGLRLAPGSFFYVRTFVSVATLGQKWPTHSALINGSQGEGYIAGDATTGAWTSTATAGAFGPSAIVAPCSPDIRSIAILGSSSAQGQGDVATTTNPGYDLGYLARAATASGIDYTTTARATDRLSFFIANYRRRLEHLALAKPTHVIQQLGSNDISNSAPPFATVRDRILTVWDILEDAGYKVVQTTYTPVNNSTDGWTTTANQSKLSHDAVRLQVNDWLRSQPRKTIPIIEVSDQVETSRNSGIWLPNYTADGTHLNPAAHTAVAATIDYGAFF